MRLRERWHSGRNDLFTARLDLVDMNRPLAKRGRRVEWAFLRRASAQPVATVMAVATNQARRGDRYLKASSVKNAEAVDRTG